jgi:type II secretory pathway component GspD/PulD (secretin)
MRRIAVLALALIVTGHAASTKPERALDKAAKLADSGRYGDAERLLNDLIASAPGEAAYRVALEAVRQKRAVALMQEGDRALAQGLTADAQSLFAQAYSLDPKNEYARQRFSDARAGLPGPKVEVLEAAEEIQLRPKPGVRSFEYRGDTRGLFDRFAREFGLSVEFENSFQSRPVRFTLPSADFQTALRAVSAVSDAFIVPLAPDKFLVAADRQEERRRLERFSMRTFFVPDAASPTDLIEVVNVLRMIFDIRQIMPNQATASVTVRAPGYVLDAAQRLLEDLSQGRPEIMVDVQVLQITRSHTTNIGTNLPLQFTAFNVNTELRKIVSDPNLQALIDRLAAGGQLSPGDAAALAALVAAAQNASSPLLQPFATFGGGITRTGVVIPPASVNLQLNSSDVRMIQRVTMRAQHGKPATYRIGDRFPVLTGTFSPLTVLNVPLPPSLRQTANTQPLVPSFNYEDLGITFKTTPSVTSEGEIRLDFDLALRALAGQSFNGVPAISNRQYVGSINVMEGETSVISGILNTTEQKTLRGLPLLSQIPGLRHAFSTTTNDKQDAQLLLLVTAHRVRSGHTGENPEIFLPPAGSAQ